MRLDISYATAFLHVGTHLYPRTDEDTNFKFGRQIRTSARTNLQKFCFVRFVSFWLKLCDKPCCRQIFSSYHIISYRFLLWLFCVVEGYPCGWRFQQSVGNLRLWGSYSVCQVRFWQFQTNVRPFCAVDLSSGQTAWHYRLTISVTKMTTSNVCSTDQNFMLLNLIVHYNKFLKMLYGWILIVLPCDAYAYDKKCLSRRVSDSYM